MVSVRSDIVGILYRLSIGFQAHRGIWLKQALTTQTVIQNKQAFGSIDSFLSTLYIVNTNYSKHEHFLKSFQQHSYGTALYVSKVHDQTAKQ